MNWDFSFMLTEAWLQGALGGAVLGLGRMILTFIHMDHSNPNTKYWRFFLAHIVAAFLFAALGAAVSWGFEGKAGNFMQGISAMAVLALLGGSMLPSHNPPASTPSSPAAPAPNAPATPPQVQTTGSNP